jgi:hypothetical protein
MSDFSHVSDEGVRTFLESEEPLNDHNIVASQLDYAMKCVDHDAQDEKVPLELLELREGYYDEACEYFGWRRLDEVRECLRRFWRV